MLLEKTLTFKDRAQLATNPTAKQLFEIMELKSSNLAVAADVTLGQELLDFAERLGPEICVFKTHIDIVYDFAPVIIEELKKIAKEHNFLIFEDRKFADIGNTVKLQYEGGIYRIAEWSDITNAHTVPGPGIIQGLKEVGLPLGRGLLLLAEMSSKGSLATSDYTQSTLRMAKEHADFVIGFIARRRQDDDPRFITMTPGVNFSGGNDKLGQQYLSPREVIVENKSDIIIVGRDIIKASDPVKQASMYRKTGWDEYQKKLGLL